MRKGQKATEETIQKLKSLARRKATPEFRKLMSDLKATPLDKAQVEALYHSGKTMVEIAEILKVSVNVVFGFMHRHHIKSRVPGRRVGVYKGTNAPNWRGEIARYNALHMRIRDLRGKPRKCEICGTADITKHYDWANLTGKYDDPDDYKRMCRSCHIKFDRGGKPFCKNGHAFDEHNTYWNGNHRQCRICKHASNLRTYKERQQRDDM